MARSKLLILFRMRILTVAAIVLIGALSSQDLPAVTESHGAFAFPDLQGTELIVLHPMQHAADARTAICAGRSVAVRFVRQQAGTGMPAGDRESPKQFDRLAGTVFQALGKVQPGETCFIAANRWLENAELLSVRARATKAECTAVERSGIAALRDRPIRKCWSLPAAQRLGIVAIAEYVRMQGDALVSLIVLASDGLMAVDFPATNRDQGEDLWRAGDGGVFSPDGFDVLFIVRRGSHYFIAVDWRGEEGNSLALYATAPGRPAQQVIQDYWYRAPR